MVILTDLHHLQDGRQAPVQSREVWYRQKGGHTCQRVLGQGLPHDITQTEAREGQETQAEQGGATDPGEVCNDLGFLTLNMKWIYPLLTDMDYFLTMNRQFLSFVLPAALFQRN